MYLNTAKCHLVLGDYLPPFLILSFLHYSSLLFFQAWSMNINSCLSLPHESCGKFFTTRTGHSCPRSKADFQLNIETSGSIAVWWDPTSIKVGRVAAVQGPPLNQTTPQDAAKNGFHFTISISGSRNIMAYTKDSMVWAYCAAQQNESWCLSERTKMLIDESLFLSPPSKTQTKNSKQVGPLK